MNILAFDTETTGFISPNYPFNHPNQGRVLQVAALLLDDSLYELASFYTLIDIPDYCEIHPGALEAHGITKDRCKSAGIPIEAAIIILDSFRTKAERIIGHNISFDVEMIHHEESAIFGQPRFSVNGNTFCTMKTMTDVCKIPHPKMRGKFKWPKLKEAYRHCFGLELDGAHDSLADIRATVAIYKWLKEKEISQSCK